MATPFKQMFFQRPFYDRLAAEIRRVHPRFDSRGFMRAAVDEQFEARELMDRMHHTTEVLHRFLPADYREALAILLKVEKQFSGFDHMAFADFVGRFGVADFDASIAALEVLTRTSAEFAIRPFIRAHPEKTLARMLTWTSHPGEHVRRLASEGCRPRLPWGSALTELQRDPSPILPILEKLRDDPSEKVRRSVANNLGDIAKDHPDLVIDLASHWLSESPARAPLLKHALRTVMKKGNQRALALFGIRGEAGVEVSRLTVTPRSVPLGGAATLRVALRSTRRSPQRLRLEYQLTYARPAGRTARKVFRIAEVELAAASTLDLTRRLSFADRSIRRHYKGRHMVTLVVNGRQLKTARFELV